MKQESAPSGNREVHHFVEKNVKTTNLKSKIQVPRCRSPIQITEQLEFDFYEPTCGNSKQPSTLGAFSQAKPYTRYR